MQQRAHWIDKIGDEFYNQIQKGILNFSTFYYSLLLIEFYY